MAGQEEEGRQARMTEAGRGKSSLVLETRVGNLDVIARASRGDGEGQGTLACCSLWSHKELDTTERWNNRCSGENAKHKS